MAKEKGPKSDNKPFTPNETVEVHKAAQTNLTVGESAWVPSGRKVLVLSNKQSLRELLQNGFADLGYDVRVSGASLEALKMVKAGGIELVAIESVFDGESCGEFLSLMENVSGFSKIAVIVVCDDFHEPALQGIQIPYKNLCIAKASLSKDGLKNFARQLLDSTYDPEAEKKKLNGRVLVCESIEDRAVALKGCLATSGLDVVLATSIDEGLLKARATMPDVVIVGADVVGGGAIEFVSHVKSDRALEAIPCLVLCDEQSRAKVRSGAFGVGALGCVMYPLISEEVLAQVGVMAKLTQTLATMQENAVSLAVSNFELSEARGLLEEQKKELERGSNFKSEFLAKMSHELRTPLTGMLGFAQRLMDMYPSDVTHKEAVATIMRNGDHLIELINDILDLSKIEAGKLDIAPQSTSPIDLLHDIRALMLIRAEQKGLNLSVEALDDIPERIITDPMRLKQIILNLVGNAIKFTQRGSVRVVVSCDRTEETMQFQVIDTGMGMTPEAKDRLFQAFMQGDTEVTRRFGGTGLGLTISLQLAEMLGGTIAVDSILGMGSSFKVTIKTGTLEGVPVVSPTEIARARESKINSSNFEKIKLSGRILVAEDNPDSRRVLEHYLKRAGAEVVFVENGKDAVSKALADSPDLIMMDMQMPILSGYDATKKLREQGFTKPIIAITANALASEIKKCMDAGCSHAQAKPFNWPSLFTLLNEFIGIRSIDESIKTESVSKPIETKTVNTPPPRSEPVIKKNIEPPPQPEPIKVAKEEPKTDEETKAIISDLFEEAPDLRPLIIDFISGLDPYRVAIRNALKSKDWAGLKQTAHDLSGISGMYGYSDTSEVAKKLRLSCMQKDIDEIRSLSSELLNLIDRMKYGLPIMNSGGAQEAPAEPVTETTVIISELVNLSPDLIPQVIEFIDSLGTVVARINRAYKANNWRELREASNEAAGTAQLYGYPKLAEVNQQIEVAAKEKDSIALGSKIKELHTIKEAIVRGKDQLSS
jgi:signal transduction histidine kinase/HPt (histidine-containing phosphotransfer) domain-containing protein